MQFDIKRKDVSFRSRNKVPRNILVSIFFTNFKSQNGAPNWPFFQNVENWPNLRRHFGDLKLVNYTENNVFLGSLFLDLKGKSFLLM